MRAETEMRVSQALHDMIADADVGTRLPSERALAGRLGVARMTLRRAMDTLVTEGRIERRRGSGAFVRQPILASRMQLLSFTEEMRARGMVPSTRVIDFHEVALPRAIASSLHVAARSSAHRVTRLRLGDDIPIGVETIHVPAWTGIDFTPDELTGSLYALLWDKYDIEVASARMSVRVDRPDAATAALLGLPPQRQALRIDMVDADIDGRPLMTAHCWYHPDRYEIQLAPRAVRRAS